MGKVTRLRHVLPMGQDINAAVSVLDKDIADAVDAAKAAGLPGCPRAWSLDCSTAMPTHKPTRW